MNEFEAISDDEIRTQQEAYYLDQVWGKWDDNFNEDKCHPQPRDNPCETARWESRGKPPAAKDPHLIPDNFNQGKRNRSEKTRSEKRKKNKFRLNRLWTVSRTQSTHRGEGEGLFTFQKTFSYRTKPKGPLGWFQASSTQSAQSGHRHHPKCPKWTQTSKWTQTKSQTSGEDKRPDTLTVDPPVGYNKTAPHRALFL